LHGIYNIIKLDTLAVWIAARDPATGRLPKLIALIVAAYALSPIDLIPDFIPVLGYIDDLILIPMGITLTVKLIPSEVMDDFRRRASLINEQPTSYAAALAVIIVWILSIALVGKYFLAHW